MVGYSRFSPMVVIPPYSPKGGVILPYSPKGWVIPSFLHMVGYSLLSSHGGYTPLPLSSIGYYRGLFLPLSPRGYSRFTVGRHSLLSQRCTYCSVSLNTRPLAACSS